MNAKGIIAFSMVMLLCISQKVFSQITASQDSGCAPLTGVQFTSPPGTANWQWDFDDGTFSSLQNPVHNFPTADVYNVRLTATGGSGSILIYVFDAPDDPGFTALTPRQGCVGLAVDFQDTSSGSGGAAIAGWEWTFGDGGFDNSNDPTPSYTYTLQGAFDVTLLIRDQHGCEASVIYNDYIKVSDPPAAVITSVPVNTSSCTPPLSIDFSGASSESKWLADTTLTYEWNFGDGSPLSILATPPTHTYTADGSYTVQLVVTDVNGCQSTATKVVAIGSPLASFYAVGAVNDTVCNPVFFVNNSTGTNFLYTYGDNTTGVADSHLYAVPGEYFVNLQTSAGVCFDDTTIRIVVEEIAAGFTSDPGYSCETPLTVQFTDQSVGAVEWEWFFGDGTQDSAQNPLHEYAEPDNPDKYYIYPQSVYADSLIVTSEHGCRDTFVAANNDSLFRPTALFSIDTAEGCVPLPVTFTDSSISYDRILTYMWDFDDGSVYSGPDSQVAHTYAAPGDYNVIFAIGNDKGCVDTSYSIHIRVGLPPNPDFMLDKTVICPYDTVQFTDLTPAADSADTWHYDADNSWMSHCYTDGNPSWAFYSDTGFHDITLTAGWNGCYADTTIQDVIRVLGPIARFDAECDCDTPLTVHFIGEIKGVDTLVWDFGDSTILGTTTDYNPTHTYSAAGNYTVTLTGYNLTSGCDSFVTQKVVFVRQLNASFLPDVNYCAKVPYIFDASASTDVWGFCNRGYRWVFEEGITPPIHRENPVLIYEFQTSGIHEITLVVRDENECYDTLRQTVNVYGVNVDFTVNDSIGCRPFTVFFDNISTADTTIASYTWDFGDGTGASADDTSHTYATPDTFLATLTVEDVLGCATVDTMQIISSQPTARLLPVGSLNLCRDDSIRFVSVSAGPGWTFDWAFGDGDSATTTINVVSHVYDSIGEYLVWLKVKDAEGCTATYTTPFSQRVRVQGRPDAHFTSSVDDSLNSLCYPIQIEFYDSSTINPPSPLNYFWDLGDGNPTINNDTVGKLYDQPGTYTVSLIVATQAAGCADTTYRDFIVRGPQGDFNMSASQICKGDDITFTIKDTFDVFSYRWDFGDGTDTTDVSPVTHTYDYHPPGGSTLARLIVFSEGMACSYPIEYPVSIYQIIADFNRNNETDHIDTSHCLGTPDNFTNMSQGADSYTWDLGDGATFSNSNPPTHIYAAPGVYNVRMTVRNDALGCTDTIIKPMIITANPVAVAQDAAICEDSVLQLNGSGGVSYSWVPDTDLSNDTIANPTALPSQTTDYTLFITDINGCTDDTTITITVYNRPPAITWDTLIIIGDTVTLDEHPFANDSGYVFTWTPEEYLSCTICPKPVAQPSDSITYYVDVEDSLKCFKERSTFIIEVLPETRVDVPTAFTPNGDGHNDYVFVRGWGIKTLLSFQIYNRWGQLMFELKDVAGKDLDKIKNAWDGTYLGKQQNIDSYAYQVSVETWREGEVKKKEGFISLLR